MCVCVSYLTMMNVKKTYGNEKKTSKMIKTRIIGNVISKNFGKEGANLRSTLALLF